MGVSFTVKIDHADPWVTYRAPSAGLGFDVQPEVAMAYFANKGLKPTFSWMDMLGEAHDQAFTVAKMMDIDLLAEVRAQVDAAIANGTTLADFKKALIPKLQAAGWWGKHDVVDPLTGKVVKAQLGSARRLELIFRTNLQVAYSAGHWANAQATKAAMPYLLYDAVDDSRTRLEHALLDGKVLPVDSPFWRTHYPPNGYNCRCGVIQMSQQDLEDFGLKVSKEPKIRYRPWLNPRTGKWHKVPTDLDPGWDHNPGASQSEFLKKLFDEKVAALPLSMRKAVLESQEALDAAKQRAIEAEAQRVLSKIEDEKTKYLYGALQQIKKSAAGKAMSPEELLQAAKDKAAKAEASADLAHYKQAVIKGAKPSKKAQAAYDALPVEAQKSIDAELLAKAEVLQVEKSAAAKLADIAANPKGQTLKAKALEKLQTGDGWGDLSAVQKLEKVEAQAAVDQAKASTASALSGYKKKVLEGKTPTPAQKAALDTLSDDEQLAFLAKVSAAKDEVDAFKGVYLEAFAKTPSLQEVQGFLKSGQQAKAEVLEALKAKQKPAPAVDPGAPEDWSGRKLIRTGSQKGSNEGGFFRDEETGIDYYLKTPKDEGIARNEVLAAKLYELAGVDVPELTLIRHDGKLRIASKVIPDVQKMVLPIDPVTYPGLYDDFAVDAWLANWDVVGLEYDNLLVKGKKFYRIDVGGSLLYRAQGTPKGAKFGTRVDELKSLLDAAINPQSAKVFGKITKEAIAQSAQKVASVSDGDIRRVVDLYGPGDLAAKKALAEQLIARKADLLARAAPELSEAAKAAKALAIEEAKLELQFQLEAVDKKIVDAIKGIAYRAKQGLPIEQKDLDRAAQAFNSYSKFISDNRRIVPTSYIDKLDKHYIPWLNELETAVQSGKGKVVNWGAKGQFIGYKGTAEVIESEIKFDIPDPNTPKTYTDAQAKKILNETLGISDYAVSVPTNRPGYTNFSGMPIQMQRSITAYTGGYYTKINNALRGESGLTAKKKMQELADLINASLDAAPTKYKGLVTRGLSLSGDELKQFIDTHKQAYLSGGTVIYDAFTSAAKGEYSKFTGNIKLKIQSKNGVYVRPLSQFPSENEVLFKAGSKFFVDDIRESGDSFTIYLTEA